MIYRLLLAALCCVVFSVNAEARQRHRAPAYASCIATNDIMRPCAYQPNFLAGVRSIKVTMRRVKQAANPRPRQARREAVSSETLVDRARSYMNGIVAPLAAKVSEIQSACGSRIVSGVRHSYIAGTHRISLHASGKAVDMAGNPSCIYSMLHGWAGGYSTDYARVAHVHLSYDPEGGREMGARFVHGGGHRHRYAHHRHHRRYASAG